MFSYSNINKIQWNTDDAENADFIEFTYRRTSLESNIGFNGSFVGLISMVALNRVRDPPPLHCGGRAKSRILVSMVHL